jgi:hypothetical protein
VKFELVQAVEAAPLWALPWSQQYCVSLNTSWNIGDKRRTEFQTANSFISGNIDFKTKKSEVRVSTFDELK